MYALNGMVLCFYTAYLFRLPSINSAKTIQNYSSQLKSTWSKIGILITEFDESMRRDIIKGAQKLLPAKPDMRPAFLLPHYFLRNIFLYPGTISQVRLRAAVIWGFFWYVSLFNVREAWYTESFYCRQDWDGTPH